MYMVTLHLFSLKAKHNRILTSQDPLAPEFNVGASGVCARKQPDTPESNTTFTQGRKPRQQSSPVKNGRLCFVRTRAETNGALRSFSAAVSGKRTPIAAVARAVRLLESSRCQRRPGTGAHA